VSAPPPPYVAEPPAHYLVQPPLVVDCSVVAGRVFQEEWKAQAQVAMDGRTLHAPHLLNLEIASVALKKHRQGHAEMVQDGLAAFAQLRITLHTVPPALVLDLAIRYQLSAYDAAYLWLSAELKAPLATFDAKLGAAAQTHLASLD
jgi:predicted nucleic acid-binding protein